MRINNLTKRIPFVLLWVALHLPLVAGAQTSSVILIGDTTNMVGANGELPYAFMSSSYTQQLVTADEMNGAAVITGIDFYCDQASSIGRAGCTIYLANTFVSDLYNSMVPFGAAFAAVSVDSFVCSLGWNHYEFDTPVYYYGFTNLIVAVDAPWGMGGTFYTESVQGRARYVNVPLAYLTPNMHTSAASDRNVMRLHTTPAGAPVTCPAPTVWVDSLGSDAVKLKWNPGYRDTSWTVECVTDGDTVLHSSGLVWGDTSYTMTGLTPNTHYAFRVTAFCSDTFTTVLKHVLTNCMPVSLPYSENFDSIWHLPDCWYTVAGTAGDSPAFSSRSHSASNSIQLNGGAVVLPVFDVTPDSLEIYFGLQRTPPPHRFMWEW